MRLLLDQGISHQVAPLLIAAGHDAVHVRTVAMSRATDPEIIAYAQAEARAVITLDADFHAFIAVSNARGPTVIRIRIEGLQADAMTRLLLRLIGQLSVEIKQGAAITVDESGVRVRLLPL